MTTVHSAGIDLLERLGGSSAVVHRAVVRTTGRVVVAKHAGWDRPAVTQRLGREAAVLRRVQHASLVRLVDQVDTTTGRYLLLTHAPGGCLADVVTAGDRLPAGEVAVLGARLAAALGALHTAGVVHRDVHPGNVLLDAELRPLLADLDNALDTAGQALPGDGEVVGHRDHLDHRVLAGAVASPTSDLHGLATTLWTLATGAPPQRPSPAVPVELPIHELVPPALHELLLACVTGEAGDAAAVAARLQELATRPTRLAPPAASTARGPGDASRGAGQAADLATPSLVAPAAARPPAPASLAVTGGGTRRWGPRPLAEDAPRPSRPTGRSRRLVGAAIVAALLAGTVWRWGGPTAPDPELIVVTPPATCAGTIPDAPGQQVVADLDGDGCGEVLSLADGELHTPTGRYRLGEPGDVLLAGDWDGDGRWGVGLYRPATGAVLLIDDPGPGATSGSAQQHHAGGVPVVVEDGDHHRVRIDPA